MRRLEERWGIMNNLIGASRLDVVQGVGGGQSSSCHLFIYFFLSSVAYSSLVGEGKRRKFFSFFQFVA